MLESDFPDHQNQNHHNPVLPEHSCNETNTVTAAASSPSRPRSCDHQDRSDPVVVTVITTNNHHDDQNHDQAEIIRSPLVPESRIHVNPIFESVSYVKKKLFAKLRFSGFGHDDDDDVDEDDDAAQTKSLSIDSMYITPSNNNNEDSDEKLIQATNYFIAAALVASAVLAVVIVWLFIGLFISFICFNYSTPCLPACTPYNNACINFPHCPQCSAVVSGKTLAGMHLISMRKITRSTAVCVCVCGVCASL